MLLIGFGIACCGGVYCYTRNAGLFDGGAIAIGLACAGALTLVNWLWLLYPTGFVREGYKLQWLLQRGVTTQGRVVAHEQHAGGRYSGPYKVSVVSFKTLTTPPVQCKVEGRTIEPVGRKLDLIYDPTNPHKNARVGQRPTSTEVKRAFLLGSLASLPFIGIMLWMDIAVAFIKV
jgi:hypothetical protein